MPLTGCQGLGSLSDSRMGAPGERAMRFPPATANTSEPATATEETLAPDGRVSSLQTPPP